MKTQYELVLKYQQNFRIVFVRFCHTTPVTDNKQEVIEMDNNKFNNTNNSDNCKNSQNNNQNNNQNRNQNNQNQNNNQNKNQNNQNNNF